MSNDLELFTTHCVIDGKDVDDTVYDACIACTFGPSDVGDYQKRSDAVAYATQLCQRMFDKVCRDFPAGEVHAWVSSDRGTEWEATRP